jgi:hypothetical protein
MACIDALGSLLACEKGTLLDKVIEGFEKFYIGVEIDTAISIKDFETSVI